jgi:hypothetical protein
MSDGHAKLRRFTSHCRNGWQRRRGYEVVSSASRRDCQNMTLLTALRIFRMQFALQRGRSQYVAFEPRELPRRMRTWVEDGAVAAQSTITAALPVTPGGRPQCRQSPASSLANAATFPQPQVAALWLEKARRRLGP